MKLEKPYKYILLSYNYDLSMERNIRAREDTPSTLLREQKSRGSIDLLFLKLFTEIRL